MVKGRRRIFILKYQIQDMTKRWSALTMDLLWEIGFVNTYTMGKVFEEATLRYFKKVGEKHSMKLISSFYIFIGLKISNKWSAMFHLTAYFNL